MQSAGKWQDKSSAARAPQEGASCSPGAADAGQQGGPDSSRPQPAQEDMSDVAAPAQGSSRPAAPAEVPVDAAPADTAGAAKMQLQSADRAPKEWPQAAGSVAQVQPGESAGAEAAGSTAAQTTSAAQTLPEAASVSSKAPGRTLERSSTTASSRLVDAGRATLRRRQTEGELPPDTAAIPQRLRAPVGRQFQLLFAVREADGPQPCACHAIFNPGGCVGWLLQLSTEVTLPPG